MNEGKDAHNQQFKSYPVDVYAMRVNWILYTD